MTATARARPTTRVRVTEVTRQRPGGATREDRLAGEEPLEIRLAWPGHEAARVAVTMRTPGHDFELAAGFLYGEGVLGAGQLHTVAYCTSDDLTADERFNVVTVTLRDRPAAPPAPRYAGPGGGSSACGVCGVESITDVLARCGPSDGAPADSTAHDQVVPADVVHRLPETLRDQQRIFDSTGGLHGAGLFEADGTPVVVREDIGRHNAVDKVIGARLLAGAPTALPVLCVSGRIGFEIVQKAVAAGVGVLVAVGAPSSLAVALAERAGLCAIGFVRADRYVVYSHPHRIGVV